MSEREREKENETERGGGGERWRERREVNTVITEKFVQENISHSQSILELSYAINFVQQGQCHIHWYVCMVFICC